MNYQEYYEMIEDLFIQSLFNLGKTESQVLASVCGYELEQMEQHLLNNGYSIGL